MATQNRESRATLFDPCRPRRGARLYKPWMHAEYCKDGPRMRQSVSTRAARCAGNTQRMPVTDAELATPKVSASDTIRTTGILHFTIGVRDHIAAAKFYSEVLGC